jgi:BlaI family transcriptional regulator, penicillinase repressor
LKKQVNMERLTRKEEEAMKILWKAKKGFVKDLLELHTEPKPHYNTFSTLIRGLEEKGYISHKAFGKNHQYFPLVKKEEYRKSYMKKAVSDYFGSSYKNVVSFFIDENKLDADDLREIIKLIEKGEKNG